MVRKIFNASNVFGAAAFLIMILIPGAVDSEMYIAVVVFMVLFVLCTYLSIKEDGGGR